MGSWVTHYPLVQNENVSLRVETFYKFVPLSDTEQVQRELKQICQEANLLGTILVAAEGINGTIVGEYDALFEALGKIREMPEIGGFDSKGMEVEVAPFHRLKVRLKKEIVALKFKVDPTKLVGTYVEPEDWNELLEDPDLVLIDTRNDYEVADGRFPGAIDPKTESFSQFVEFVETLPEEFKERKVAMYCTGGIRCEKASSYMLERGFKQVFHLHGGILKYQLTVPAEERIFEGKNFVFDDRRAFDPES